jgi:Trk K+ transport system NAD-binding subunit
MSFRKDLVRGRKIRASIRDTWLLLREFAGPLTAFIIAICGGGLLYYFLTSAAGEPVNNPLESIYYVLLLTFLQPAQEFPEQWYLEIFFFIMPVIGIIIVSHGVTDFGLMLFNRRARGKEWEMAVASTYSNHHVLVGLGHLGFRVARNLHDLEQDVVVIEANPSAEMVASIKRMGIPVIDDNASRESTLEIAGIKKARSIVLCTQNDSLNLQIALKARRINPKIRVVIRIFDNEFAQALNEQFGFTAFSATSMAAPSFAAAAAGVEMTNPISIDGETLSLAHLTIADGSRYTNLTVGEVEKYYNLSIVLLRRNHHSDLHPAPEIHLSSGDVLAVLGGPLEIGLLVQENIP